MNKDYVKYLKEKDKQVNNYCAAIRRDEMKCVVNNAHSGIDWKQYETK